MNLSEDTIKHLEKKAYLRGMEEASRIASDVADGLDCEEKSGARDVQYKLDQTIERLSVELGEMEEV